MRGIRSRVVSAALVVTIGTVSRVALADECICGNGVTDTVCGEECDDGGICIGSTNAGARCTSPAQCPGGVCTPFGGDGCAANCTQESEVLLNLVPGRVDGTSVVGGTSGVGVHADILNIAVPLSGQVTLTIGKQRSNEIPVAIKVRNIRFPRINVSNIVCECVRPAAAKTCGGTVFEPDGITPSPDCTLDDRLCAGRKPCTFMFGNGNSAAGVIGCDGLENINFLVTQDAGGATGSAQPPVFHLSGMGPPGSARLFSSAELTAVLGLCPQSSPDYGPDEEFCTDDDPPSPGFAVVTNPLVTGLAAGQLFNANGVDTNNVGPFAVAGAPFSCAALGGVPPHADGAALAGVSTQLQRPTTGDVVFTSVLVAGSGPGSCIGDCNGDQTVTVSELLRLVNIALGNHTVTDCESGDTNGDGHIAVDEILVAIVNALAGCG